MKIGNIKEKKKLFKKTVAENVYWKKYSPFLLVFLFFFNNISLVIVLILLYTVICKHKIITPVDSRPR